MFPMYNAACSYIEYPQYKTEPELRKCATDQANKVTSLEASIDVIKVQNQTKIELSLHCLIL